MIKTLWVIGLFLRLLGLINIRLGGDFALYWKVAGNIVSGTYFPLLGSTASIYPNLHFGPIFYYILSIPYLLGRGHYQSAIIFFSLLNSLNILLIYRIAREMFTKKIAYTAATLYTFSAFSISTDSFPWNYNILPLLILLALYFLLKIQKGKHIFLPLMFLFLGLGAQIHIVVSLLFPVYFLLLPLRKIRFKYWLISGVVIIITLLPYLLQFRHVLAISQPKWELCDFWYWLQYHGRGERCFHFIRNPLFVFRFFSQSLFSTQSLFMVGMSFLMTVFMLLKKDLRQRQLFLTWLGIPILILLIYSSGVLLHYFIIFFPLPIFLFCLFLDDIKKVGKRGEVLGRILLFSTVLLNLAYYFVSLGFIRV